MPGAGFRHIRRRRSEPRIASAGRAQRAGAALLLAGSLLALTHAAQAAAPPAGVPARLDDRCWALSFEDDFDTLDLWSEESQDGQWRTRYIWGRDTIINNELQYYIDPREHGMSPFDVNDGILSIIASPTPESLRDRIPSPYVSGVLTTEKGFNHQYGRFEVRARVPSGKGLWSAFWLLPSFDRWPEGVAVLPEIDVMEHLGDEPSTYHASYHTNQSGELASYPYDHTVRDNLTRDFHLYSVIWTADTVSWYLDGEHVISRDTPDDFTRPVHMLLNLAVGGNWPGAPDSGTRFPARLMVDFVRHYEEAPCG